MRDCSAEVLSQFARDSAALSPVIGCDKESQITHYAMDNDLTLKEAALKLGFVTEELFDRVVDPAKMVRLHVAGDTAN
jgi:fumarate hydratase class II